MLLLLLLEPRRWRWLRLGRGVDWKGIELRRRLLLRVRSLALPAAGLLLRWEKAGTALGRLLDAVRW